MSNLITLESVDVDGAVREAEDGAFAAGLDRGQFIKRGAMAGGSFLAGGVLFSGLMSPAQAAISTKKSSKKNDVKILNYALTLEFLEAEFYIQGLANNAFAGNGSFSAEAFKTFATVTSAHESAHVAYLKKALGSAAIKKPKFSFGAAVTDAKMFAATAQVLEDTGVSAYAGQGPNISQKAVVKAALEIHSVEARHAAWIRFLNGGGAPGSAPATHPAPVSFDKPKSEKAVLKAVAATKFIAK